MTTQSQLTLNQAIAAAVEQAKQEQRQSEENWQAFTEQIKQKAISEFQLPFDAETIALLPPCIYECDLQDPQNVVVKALFTYQEVNFRIWRVANQAIKRWTVAAAIDIEDDDCPESFVVSEDFCFYPDSTYYDYLSPEELRMKFLVFLSKAVAEAQKQRTAMQLSKSLPQPSNRVELSRKERLTIAVKVYTAMIAGGCERKSWNEIAGEAIGIAATRRAVAQAIDAVEAFVEEFNNRQQ